MNKQNKEKLYTDKLIAYLQYFIDRSPEGWLELGDKRKIYCSQECAMDISIKSKLDYAIRTKDITEEECNDWDELDKKIQSPDFGKTIRDYISKGYLKFESSNPFEGYEEEPQ